MALINHSIRLEPTYCHCSARSRFSANWRHWRAGTNRAHSNRPQIAANSDVDAIKAWLARYLDTNTTFSNFRKEAERLLLWSTIQLGKPLSSLTHEDCLVYQHFLKDPQPAQRWVLPNGRKVARSHPDWRPFAGPLSPTSIRQAIVILNALFSWLVTADYLAGNPLSLSRQRNRRAPPRMTRYPEEDLWAEVKLTIDQMPRETGASGSIIPVPAGCIRCCIYADCVSRR